MSKEVTFTIPGRPQAWQRVSGYGGRSYVPKRTADYENSVKSWAAVAMRRHGAGTLLEPPLYMRISCFFDIAVSWPKQKRQDSAMGIVYPTAKPDIDNIVKSVMDGCKDVVWRDDCEVTDLVVTKRFHQQPKVLVTVREIDGKLGSHNWTAKLSVAVRHALTI